MTATADRMTQRTDALRSANAIRAKRAKHKRTMRYSDNARTALVLGTPEWAATWVASEYVAAIPGFGPSKADRAMTACGIAAGVTLGALTDRQRSALAAEIKPPSHRLKGMQGDALSALADGEWRYAFEIAETVGTDARNIGATLAGLRHRGLVQARPAHFAAQWRATASGKQLLSNQAQEA